MKKLHYYNFTFLEATDSKMNFGTVCVGYPENFVSHPQIDDAKKHANIGDNSVMISCSYLGKMTHDQFENGG